MTVTLSQHTAPTADQPAKAALFMPVAFDCIDSHGNHYGDDNGLVKDGMVILDKPELTLTFSDVKEPLIPVILGNFSAPAKVHNDLSAAQLLNVFQYAHDSFNRWDALQSLYSWCINCYEQGKPEAVDDTIWQGLEAVLTGEADNHELLGECLVIPSFETLCQTRSQVDVAALNSARDAFCQTFSEKLAKPLKAIFDSISTSAYTYSQQAVNARRCRNQVLVHLARLDDQQSAIEAQFAQADNMTDTLGALKAAQAGHSQVFETLMREFEQRWNQDPLVLDKWFGLHATTERDDILSQLTLLQQHPQFTIGNPNRVRAVVGSFAFFNTAGFHNLDGSGYKFVTDYLMELDKVNPQVAARIVTPLTQWHNFSPVHQELMKTQLNRLLGVKELSSDLFEKVSKSLAYQSNSER